ncbi:hypothetical protein MPSI1_003038 [Malassezia psittaci]|uniref:HMG box domain-containing protein n=1 Tax=Malassezia psittaci TaxID=1821823 RepID=A0AAF0JF84_9BASI|nr:hypothetical protein MPSI1_003038 [Malassezia psittaci]
MLLNRLFVGLAAQALFQRVAGTSNAPIARAPLTTSALVKLAKNTNQPAVKAKATPKSARKSSTATTNKSKADVTADATAKAEKAKKLAEKRESAKQDKLQRELANKEKKQKEKEKALAQKQKEKARELARKEKEKAKELAKKEKKQKDKARELARKEKEKAKELAKKEKASKAKTPKDKPWELRDADGKLDRFVQLKHLDEYQKISPSSGKRIPDLVAMTTSVAKEWKELPDAQRAEFEKKVAESKVQYEKDLQAWRESLTPEDIRRQNLYYSHQRKAGKVTPSNLRDPNMPKRPPGAFFLFVQEQRNAGSLSGSVLEQSRQAGEMWKSMSADKRQAYEKLGAQQLEEYSQAMEKYKASNQIA